MSVVVIKFKNGESQRFEETYRSGGSWCTWVKFENGWVIVTDAYGERYAYPSDDVASVNEKPTR